MPGRPRGWYAVVAAGVGIALIVAGGVVAVRGYLASGGPDGAVRGYLTALQHGDAPTALAYGALPAGNHALLTSAVLSTQQRLAPLRDVQLGAVRRSGGGQRASVPVRYRLDFAAGAQSVSGRIAVHRTGGGWRLDRVAVTTRLALAQAGSLASIAGGAVPTGEVALFPGAVPVHFATPYLQLDTDHDATASVGFGGSSRTELRVRASAAGVRAAVAATTRALTRCVTTGGDLACPLPGDAYVPGSLRGRIGRTARLPNGTRLSVTVGRSAAGVLDIDGETGFTGRFQVLTTADQPRSGHGSALLDVHAQAVASAPLHVQWTAS